MPTRLLDWTANPLIALWFAFEGEKGNTKDRIVWGLVVERESIVNFETDHLFGGRFVKVFKPYPLDDRIRNQESWFSVQAFEIFGEGGDGLPKFDNYNTVNENYDFEYYIEKFKFKNEIRIEILDEIDKQGINSMKIFPGLQGLCKTIEWNQLDRNYPQQAL